MKTSFFNDPEFFRPLFAIALPLALQNFIVSSLNLVDTIIIKLLPLAIYRRL